MEDAGLQTWTFREDVVLFVGTSIVQMCDGVLRVIAPGGTSVAICDDMEVANGVLHGYCRGDQYCGPYAVVHYRSVKRFDNIQDAVICAAKDSAVVVDSNAREVRYKVT